MTTLNVPAARPVYRLLHRPLTVAGVDRRLFFLALLVGAATFNLFYSFLAGCLLFAVVYGFAWFSTARDPHLLHILLRAGLSRPRYDAAKHAPMRQRGR
jgi:type IV secretory pathway TrbD component